VYQARMQNGEKADGNHCDIAIIGAGFSGLATAHALRQSGRDDFVVFERASEVGGTWRDNTYPGCACDVESHLYSLSFAPNPDWSSRYAGQSEIQNYALEVTERFALRPQITFNATVDTLRFDDTSSLWRVELRDGEVWTARYIVAATGPLSQAKASTFAGTDIYDGTIVHSAKWPSELALAGKRVAVVGTGASAAQIIPAIAEQVRELHVLQRTPPWVLKRHDRRSSTWSRALYRRFPLILRGRRAWSFWVNEFKTIGLTHVTAGAAIMEKQTKKSIRQSIDDEKLATQLTPHYRLGCKRVVLSDDYHAAFSKPHVHLVAEPMSHFVQHGVETTEGRAIDADIVVLATGFEGNRPLSSLKVVGPDGRNLSTEWANGAEAYLGVAVSGFPNLFCVLGPNSGSGSTSVLIMAESQIALILRLLNASHRRVAVRVEVDPAIQQRYNAWLNRRTALSVWGMQCNAWYKTPNGKNVGIFPDFANRFQKMCAKASEGSFLFS
jgi:cation diffusion facilitator CzcD-associated flavoprotein CzcO